MSARQHEQALAEIVALATRHGLGADEIAAALAAVGNAGDLDRAAAALESAATDAAPRSALATRFLAYLGGVFVFAGLGIYVAMEWEAMTPAARVVITLGPGIASFVLAWLAAREPRFAAAATPLFLVAALLEPTGLGVLLDEYAAGNDWRVATLLVSGVMLAQQLGAFLLLRRALLLFTALAFGSAFAATSLDLLGVSYGLNALTVGLSVVCLALAVQQRTRHAAIAPFWVFLGTASALTGAFDLLHDTAAEPLFAALACGAVYASAVARSRAMLVVATLALLGYIGYFTSRHFVDIVGWPLSLMVLGAVMLGLSAVAVRINRRYIRAAA